MGLGLVFLAAFVAIWKFVRMFWLVILLLSPILIWLSVPESEDRKKNTKGVSIIPGSPLDKFIKFCKG
jgi:nitrate/nitrite transporter NarK